VFYTGQVKLYF